MTFISWKALWLCIPVFGLLYYLLADTQRPTVVRPATPIEKSAVTKAMTGWGTAFANRK